MNKPSDKAAVPIKETRRLPSSLEKGKFYAPSETHTFPSEGRWLFSGLTLTPESLIFMEAKVDGGWKCVVSKAEPTGTLQPEDTTVVLKDSELDGLGLKELDLKTSGNSLAIQRITTLITRTRQDIIPELISANPELEDLFPNN